ncbi:MOSC, N-terminal beta barrel [Burkholderiaceae bacterium]
MNSAASNTIYFPVVGCAGLERRQAADYHQRWFVVDAEGHWLSAERCAALLTVTTEIKMGALVLRAPGMLRVDIPLDVIEDDDSVKRTVQVGQQSVIVVDEGDVTATWMSHVAGQTCRLVKLHPEALPVAWPQG